ncbi:hypothetical protein PR048_010651 [Dryococelus australis]|uniref:Uncharacterized protein n=1 Tax=Dryococelus australis TaxID=614101 RepID=A0ABQ9I3A7_9NEOP|nr:hypothetical protein PR048_010651 [Dryococelus australis]
MKAHVYPGRQADVRFANGGERENDGNANSARLRVSNGELDSHLQATCERMARGTFTVGYSRLDSTVMCILESHMFVHWLLLQREASVTPHLAVWYSLLVSLQVCYWLRVVQGVSNELRSNYKGPGRAGIDGPRQRSKRRLAEASESYPGGGDSGSQPGGRDGRGVAMATARGNKQSRTANRVRSPAGSRPDFRKLESCRTMPLVGGFSRGSPVSPAPPPNSGAAPYSPQLPSSALKTSLTNGPARSGVE